MTNLGGGEIFLVLFIALIVLGPERLPEAARKIGGFVRQVRTMSTGFQDEIKKAIDVDAILKPTDRGDQPFSPEEAHIRPTPSLDEPTVAVAPELEADIRARNDEPEAPTLAEPAEPALSEPALSEADGPDTGPARPAPSAARPIAAVPAIRAVPEPIDPTVPARPDPTVAGIRAVPEPVDPTVPAADLDASDHREQAAG